jgi:hypothetical protein
MPARGPRPGLEVGEHGAFKFRVINSRAAGDEDFADGQGAQLEQGEAEEGLAVEGQPGFIAAHPAGLSAGEDDGAQLHSAWRKPEVRMRQRRPPRPRNQASAPGPRAVFIQ